MQLVGKSYSYHRAFPAICKHQLVNITGFPFEVLGFLYDFYSSYPYCRKNYENNPVNICSVYSQSQEWHRVSLNSIFCGGSILQDFFNHMTTSPKHTVICKSWKKEESFLCALEFALWPCTTLPLSFQNISPKETNVAVVSSDHKHLATTIVFP